MKKRTFQLFTTLVFTFMVSNLYAQLVASYKFNPGADSLKNDAGIGETALFAPDYLYEGDMISRAPFKVADRFNNPKSAFSFTSSNYNDVNVSMAISDENSVMLTHGGEYTLAVWIKLFEEPRGWEIVASIGLPGGDQFISVQPNYLNVGSYYQSLGGGGMPMPASKSTYAPLPSLNEWHQVVAVVKRDSVLIYTDGVQVSKAKHYGLILEASGLTIGSRASYEYGFNGLIDDVKVFESALTVAQAAELYQQDQIATNIEDAFLTEADPEIYPNPVSDQFYLTIPQRAGLPKEIKIKDLSGAELQTFSNFSGNNQIFFDASNLPSGIYLVQVLTDKGHFYKKIVKN